MDEREDSGIGEPLAIAAAIAVGAILAVGALGAVIGWLRGSSVSTAMAYSYYFIGSTVFLVGSVPTGGFSVFRGPSRRRPTGGGSFAAPAMLIGALLLGTGILLDVTHPF